MDRCLTSQLKHWRQTHTQDLTVSQPAKIGAFFSSNKNFFRQHACSFRSSSTVFSFLCRSGTDPGRSRLLSITHCNFTAPSCSQIGVFFPLETHTDHNLQQIFIHSFTIDIHFHISFGHYNPFIFNISFSFYNSIFPIFVRWIMILIMYHYRPDIHASTERSERFNYVSIFTFRFDYSNSITSAFLNDHD